MDIITKRVRGGWRVTFWCEPKSIICQIFTPDDQVQESPTVDVAFGDFESALKFAQAVCRRTPREIEKAAESVDNWLLISGDMFLALLEKEKVKCKRR